MATIAVLGAGAIGQFYAIQFLRAGHMLRLCARRDALRLARDGVRGTQRPTSQIAGSLTSTSLDEPAARMRVVSEASQLRENGDPDWLFIATKLTDLSSVAAQVQAAAGPATRVVVMGNGLGAEDALVRLGCDAQRLFGMLCFVCVNRLADGTIVHLAQGQVTVGHVGGDSSERAALAALCRGAGIQTRESNSLCESRWRKLMWNVPYNGLCTLHDCATDHILSHPNLAQQARRLTAEILETANADLAARGAAERIPAEWADEQVRRTAEMGAYLPSTTCDRRAGIALEIDVLFREPLRRAQLLGIDTPELAALVPALEKL